MLLLIGTARAGSTHDCGPYVMRHSVVASTNLSPASAEMLGITAAPNVGVINIILLNKSTRQTLAGRLHVLLRRTNGLVNTLHLRAIKSEDNATFYAAQFDYTDGEKLDFELSVSALGQPPQAFAFSQTLP